MRPRALLILCEGTTERLYFEAVIRHMRVDRVLLVEVFGNKGQHKELIKKCASERKAKAKELDLDESEIEVWAVCDCDKMRIKYQKLLLYARIRKVELAFSNPQFETYLIQHFGLISTSKKRGALISELEKHLGQKYHKGDLAWLENMIDEEPSKLAFAIANSNKFKNRANIPFLTVQNLTSRLLEFAK